MNSNDRFVRTIDAIDAINKTDPTTEMADGHPQPHEYVDSLRLSEWVLKLNPEASEELRIAARGQHIARRTSPRDSYPMDRGGYLRWREELKKMHATKVGEIMAQAGYPSETITRTQQIILKKNIKGDPDTQTLEDALSLDFLAHEFAAFRPKVSEEKMIEILRKTWRKMSESGHKKALEISFNPQELRLIKKALS